jgi:hypothetical protein
MLRDGGNADEENKDADDVARVRASVHEVFRAGAVIAPPTEIFDRPLSEREWRLAQASAVRSKPAVQKASRSRSSCSTFVVAEVHQPQKRRGNPLNSSDVC